MKGLKKKGGPNENRGTKTQRGGTSYLLEGLVFRIRWKEERGRGERKGAVGRGGRAGYFV